MRYPDAKLRGNNRGSHRGVHITIHDHPVRSLANQHRLDSLHDPCGLRGVSVRADGEIHVGRRDSQIPEERIRHGVVIVLAGVHDQLGNLRSLTGTMNRRQFGKVWARANNMEKLQVTQGRKVIGYAQTAECKCDADSWVPGAFSGQGAADMFDQNYNPKPAFTSVQRTFRSSS